MNRASNILASLVLFTLACNLETLASPVPPPIVSPPASAVAEPTKRPKPTAAPRLTPVLTPTATPALDKWSLWTNGTQLRGANIYQRRVYPELDGPDFMGPGPLGPPYTQADFDRLAAMGANYVNISHAGLFSEAPPFELDQDVQDNLDWMLELAANARLFAVISLRTGPGRSEFTFFRGGDWFDKSYYNETVWDDQAAQDGWVAMWRHIAERYRTNSVVVGYDLMVEPNANDVFFDIWNPEDFYGAYADSLYDWNRLHPRITAAIREVDPDTPILVGAMSYSAVNWLPYLKPTGDRRTVYTVHQYAPHNYTHQEPPLKLKYPGVFDANDDGVKEQVDRAWLEELLTTVEAFKKKYGVPVAVNECGLKRWEPGAAQFMDDQFDLFEQHGLNYALWQWDTSWAPLAENGGFNFRHGPDPSHHADVETSDLTQVISKYWQKNTVRP